MIILIPSYQPDRRLLELVAALAPRQVLVVDDGSGPVYAHWFAAAERAKNPDFCTITRCAPSRSANCMSSGQGRIPTKTSNGASASNSSGLAQSST